MANLSLLSMLECDVHKVVTVSYALKMHNYSVKWEKNKFSDRSSKRLLAEQCLTVTQSHAIEPSQNLSMNFSKFIYMP